MAALGTALSRDQVQSLMRFSQSKQIIFNFDADKAGVNATQRAIQEIEPLVYSGQVNLRILNLPAGKDADEFIHSSAENKEIYQTLVKQAPLWVDWQIQQLLRQKNLKDPLDFEQVARGMVEILKRLTDQNKRAYYLQLCGEILSQGDSRLISLQVNNLSSQLTYGDRHGQNGSRHWQAKDPTSSLLEKAEALLLKIYLHCPQERSTIDQILTENDLLFSFAHHRLLWQKIDQVREHFNLDSDPDNQLPLLVQLAYLEQEGDFNSVESLFQLTEASAEELFRANLRIPEAIAIMEKVPWESYQKHCFGKLQRLDPRTQAEDFRYYQQQWQKARQEIQRLENQRLNQPLN